MQSYATNMETPESMTKLIFSKFSSWKKLLRVCAWMLRFKKWLKWKAENGKANEDSQLSGHITVEEMKEAERSIVSCVQKECFHDEQSMLKSGKPVKKSSSLRRLDPVFNDSLLCVGGRLKHALDGYHLVKHPQILPKQHHVSDLVMKYYHKVSGHFGQEYVLLLVRNHFWIIQARVSVWHVVRSCFDCKQRC